MSKKTTKKDSNQSIRNTPLVSVIIPVFNVEEYVIRCLDSLAIQTYPNIEVLIVNDCSTDNTKQIVSDYVQQHKNFKLINQPKNLWPGQARNVGIDASSGTYIAFVDSDDFCTSDRIEKQVAYMESNPYIEILGTLYYEHLNGKDYPIKPRDIHQEVLDGTAPVHNPTCIIRKNVFEKYWAFDKRFEFAEDTEFYLRCYYSWVKFELLQEYLYHYRINDLSLSVGWKYKQSKAIIRVIFHLFLKYKTKYSRTWYKYLFKKLWYVVRMWIINTIRK